MNPQVPHSPVDVFNAYARGTPPSLTRHQFKLTVIHLTGHRPSKRELRSLTSNSQIHLQEFERLIEHFLKKNNSLEDTITKLYYIVNPMDYEEVQLKQLYAAIGNAYTEFECRKLYHAIAKHRHSFNRD